MVVINSFRHFHRNIQEFIKTTSPLSTRRFSLYFYNRIYESSRRPIRLFVKTTESRNFLPTNRAISYGSCCFCQKFKEEESRFNGIRIQLNSSDRWSENVFEEELLGTSFCCSVGRAEMRTEVFPRILS